MQAAAASNVLDAMGSHNCRAGARSPPPCPASRSASSAQVEPKPARRSPLHPTDHITIAIAAAPSARSLNYAARHRPPGSPPGPSGRGGTRHSRHEHGGHEGCAPLPLLAGCLRARSDRPPRRPLTPQTAALNAGYDDREAAEEVRALLGAGRGRSRRHRRRPAAFRRLCLLALPRPDWCLTFNCCCRCSTSRRWAGSGGSSSRLAGR